MVTHSAHRGRWLWRRLWERPCCSSFGIEDDAPAPLLSGDAPMAANVGVDDVPVCQLQPCAAG